MWGDRMTDSPKSRRIRRVVSCDDGGPNVNLSPARLRQIMSFEHPDQSPVLGRSEDIGEPGVEVNLLDLPVKSRYDLKYTASAKLEEMNLSENMNRADKYCVGEDNSTIATNCFSSPSDETQSSKSQCSSAHNKWIRESERALMTVSSVSEKGRSEHVAEDEKHSTAGKTQTGIGFVLSASKSSGEAAEAAIKLADRILSGQKENSSVGPIAPAISVDVTILETKTASSDIVAVDSVEDQIISEARNAAAQMISSEQVKRLVAGGRKKETHDGQPSPQMPTSFSTDLPVKSVVPKHKNERPQLGIVMHVAPSMEPGRASVFSPNKCTLLGETQSCSINGSKDEVTTMPIHAHRPSEAVASRSNSFSFGLQQSSDEEDRPRTPVAVPTNCAHQADNAVELSPECGTDVSDDAYSKLPGKLSYSPNIHKRQALLNTLDGFNKSPARRTLPLCLVGSPNGPALPSTLLSGESHKNPESLTLKRRDTPSLHVRSINESTSKIHDLLSDVKTNLATSQKLRSDGRMHAWIRQSFSATVDEDAGASEDEHAMYTSGKSKTLIVHEIRRGDWTWCSAWSPDGDRLAVATVNHHLAIIDTASSSVWKVVHDKRLSGGPIKGTTHSIRSIAWGSMYIAVGGTGDSVSIISPNGQYPVVHVIGGTGFVGSLSWRAESSILAIGCRDDRCLVVDIKTTIEDRISVDGRQRKTTLSTKLLHTIKRRDWVNAVAFSSDGKNIAMGDRSGLLSIFMYLAFSRSTSQCKEFQFNAAILAISWSTDRRWLYSSGEDFFVTVIDTSSWSIVKRIRRDRWCDCVLSSHGGRHVVVGGGKNGLAMLGVDDGWDQLKELKYDEIVPLSASWHPQDHYLAMTGQSGTIAAIETTDIPYMAGKYMHSKSRIASVDFSPDGRILAVANANGLVSFFDTTKSELEIVYELMGCGSAANCVRFSPNGKLVAISGGSSITVLNAISPTKKSRAIKSASRLCLRQTMQGLLGVESISFSPDSNMIAVNGPTTAIYTVTPKLRHSQLLKKDQIIVSAWSPDGTLFAMVGKAKYLTIYDTSESVRDWNVKFTLRSDGAGLALAWGPSVREGLQYLACGGEGKKVTILEIRTREMTWETVLVVPRPAKVTALDWHASGVLAVGCSAGSATVVDLGYLQSGRAVNEMDYNWQKQALLCFTEILRKENKNCITALRWMGTNIPGDCSKALALGGTDGVVEVLDLTERSRRKNCKQQT